MYDPYHNTVSRDRNNHNRVIQTVKSPARVPNTDETERRYSNLYRRTQNRNRAYSISSVRVPDYFIEKITFYLAYLYY